MDDFLSWDWTEMSVEIWRLLRFAHVTTRCHGLDPDGCRRGDTLWAAVSDGAARVGLAWEWVESESGSGCFLPSVQDLMTNALLTYPNGLQIGSNQRFAELLSSVTALPWQRHAEASVIATCH